MIERDAVHDPALYRELSEPFAGVDAAEKAIMAFLADVREARRRHHIPDVHLIVEANVTNADGEERSVFLTAHQGDSARALPMLAQAFGAEEAEYAAGIAHIRAQSRRAGAR